MPFETDVSLNYQYWQNVETATVTSESGTDTENVTVRRLSESGDPLEGGNVKGKKERTTFLIPVALYAGPVMPGVKVTIGSEVWKFNGNSPAPVRRLGSVKSHHSVPCILVNG